ncbi:MAG TPA: hypothetical protein VNL18_07885 [Gemmatimonadales bacterium]|nr:hypothetical protein [Gemmatimonadales bacterium]
MSEVIEVLRNYDPWILAGYAASIILVATVSGGSRFGAPRAMANRRVLARPRLKREPFGVPAIPREDLSRRTSTDTGG